MSEVSEQASEWVQRRAWAKRAVPSKRMSERCERMSGRTSKWPISVLFYFRPLCDKSKLRRKRRAGKPMTEQKLDRSFERMHWAWRVCWMSYEVKSCLKSDDRGWRCNCKCWRCYHSTNWSGWAYVKTGSGVAFPLCHGCKVAENNFYHFYVNMLSLLSSFLDLFFL